MAFRSVRAAWFLLDRREGTTEIGSRIALGLAGSDGVPEHPPAVPMRPVRCLDCAPGLEFAAGLVAWSRASLSPTAGYTTNEIRFSLAAKQYLTRYHVPPAGATSRYRPLSSKSLTCFSLGLALRIAVSVCGGASVSRMGGQCFQSVLPSCPRMLSRVIRQRRRLTSGSIMRILAYLGEPTKATHIAPRPPAVLRGRRSSIRAKAIRSP